VLLDFADLDVDRGDRGRRVSPKHDGAAESQPNGQAARPIRRDTLAERLATLDINARTLRSEMDNGMTFSVTMVRPGPVPSFEVGAYQYVGGRLPSVGETIPMRKIVGGEETRGYVTRVNPSADTPIAVTEVASEPSTDDYLA
jgi:hypothetical protein